MAVAFVAVFAALFARLYAIQIAAHDDYVARQGGQLRGVLTVEPLRGQVRDARGSVLAVSVPVESAWVNPSAVPVAERPAAARKLAGALGLREDFVMRQLTLEAPGTRGDEPAPRLREFAWLKRKLTAVEADAVRELLKHPLFKTGRRSSEPRIGLQTEFQRRYPNGPVLGQVLGFVSGDPRMNEGVERSMDRALAGERRSWSVPVDGRRRPLDVPVADLAGADVILTIDLPFQTVMEEELDAACREFHPKWAAAVAVDVRSGRVLGMSSRPAFDPNDAGRAPGESRQNRVIVAPYEPGSTLKPVLAAYAIEKALVTPKTRLDCENGLWKHGARTLHDHHPYGLLTLAEVIIHSSNIGAAKVGALILGAARLHECMRLFGFGDRSGIDLPAEDDGRLFPLARWNSFSVTSVPIGHEIAVTPLQLAMAFSAIANGGSLWKPYVIDRLVAADGTVLFENHPQAVRKVLGEKASREMIEILKGVVTGGTGKKAQVEGIAIAGKTGTTKKVDPVTKKYTTNTYISSFAGFAPADEAKVCVVVVIDEPQGAYYGGAVAAPVVGRIIQRGLVHVK
jgi:cell division protein FtsI (penicillin-binding protein 3)